MILETAETLLALSGKKNELAGMRNEHQASRNIVKELRAQRKLSKGKIDKMCNYSHPTDLLVSLTLQAKN